MTRSSTSGFTLVEAMIAIAIIGILAGLVSPSLLSALPGMRASAAARQVLSDFRFARTLAVDKGTPVVVDFDAPGNTHYRVYRDKNTNGAYDAGTDVLVKEVTLSKDYAGLSLKSNDAAAPADGVDLDGAGGNAITFRSNGSASSAGAVYVMPAADPSTRYDRNRRVRVIAATGNVAVESFATGAWS